MSDDKVTISLMELHEVRRLCEVIVNSPPDRTVKNEIENRAYIILHFILNNYPTPRSVE